MCFTLVLLCVFSVAHAAPTVTSVSALGCVDLPDGQNSICGVQGVPSTGTITVIGTGFVDGQTEVAIGQFAGSNLVVSSSTELTIEVQFTSYSDVFLPVLVTVNGGLANVTCYILVEDPVTDSSYLVSGSANAERAQFCCDESNTTIWKPPNDLRPSLTVDLALPIRTEG